MKQKWTKSPSIIAMELAMLARRKVPLTFCQHGGKAGKVFIERLRQTAGQSMLVIKPDVTLEIMAGPAILFYHAPQQPLRGFQTDIIQADGPRLITEIPGEIFLVERRRLQRVKTLGNSMVTFTLDGGNRINTCRVRDISQEGAKIIGDTEFNKETVLAPLTFTLGMRYENFEQVVIVSRATIVRIDRQQNGMPEYGIHFNVDDADRENLDQYIMLRAREDNDLE